MKVLITGMAGFIGYHTAKRFLDEGYEVVGLDCINDYYDTKLKYDKLKLLGLTGNTYGIREDSTTTESLSFYNADLSDRDLIINLVKEIKADYVINLAAQAGVRYQYQNAYAYGDSNLTGFVNLLESLRENMPKHFVYASSSSVYGLNESQPFKETDPVNHPASLYAASKRSNELIAHSYSNLFKMPTSGLRFFTVYGPWGRPDMFMYLLANSITKGETIKFFQKNGLSLWRDYTFVSDIVEGIYQLTLKPAQGMEKLVSSDPSSSDAPYQVYNIGRGEPIENLIVLQEIEKQLGKKAIIEYVEAPNTEVYKTWADTTKLVKTIGYKPQVDIKDGITEFVNWFKGYNNL